MSPALRSVHPCQQPERERRRKGRKRFWRYGVADIAAVVRLEPATVRMHIRNGVFDPESLMSMALYIARHRMTIEEKP